MKFSQIEDKIFELFNLEFCQYHGAGDCFPMLAKGTEVQVIPGLPCFHIPDLDKNWQSDKLAPLLKRETVIRKGKEQTEDPASQCADHVVFLYDTRVEGWSIHIFEMKTTMGTEAWKTVRRQLNGALYRAYTLGGVLMRNRGFHSIHTHCVYKQNWNDWKNRDMIDIEAEASGLVDYHTSSAGNCTFEWENPSIQLSLFPEIAVINSVVKLDAAGYAKIALNGNENIEILN